MKVKQPVAYCKFTAKRLTVQNAVGDIPDWPLHYLNDYVPHDFVDVESKSIHSSSDGFVHEWEPGFWLTQADVHHSQELREAPRPNATTADQRKEPQKQQERAAGQRTKGPCDGRRRPLLCNIRKKKGKEPETKDSTMATNLDGKIGRKNRNQEIMEELKT